MKYFKVIIILSLFTATLSQGNERPWVLDSRFVSLDIRKMVMKSYPELREKADLISHYSGYYSINPFLLCESLLRSKDKVSVLAKKLASVIHKQDTSKPKRLKDLPLFNNVEDGVLTKVLSDIEILTTFYGITKENKGGGGAVQPAFDLPFDHDKAWHFNGVHTWTGDNNGEPMSSIDMTRSWSTTWGNNTSNDWVAAAHGGTVSVFSSCYMRITHDSGWATDYYHLDNLLFQHGEKVKAGQPISNYANTIGQALCQGGSSSGPHLHFSLLKNGERHSLDGIALSGWNIHPGMLSYDSNPNNMWMQKDEERKFAFQHTLSHLNGDNIIDYRYSGVYSSADINGHGVNISITQLVGELATELRNVLFIAFYSYDDNGNANFYAGSLDFDNWRTDETQTVNMLQTGGGDFTHLQAIDFDSDVINAGTMSIGFLSCFEVEVSFSLLEPVNNETVVQNLMLTKTVGIPDHVCQAPSLPLDN